MKLAVTAQGADLSAEFVPIFGRSPAFLLVDSETQACEAMANEAAAAAGGAGIQAAQSLVDRGVQAVITGNVGPNAYQVLAAAGVPVYAFAGSSAAQAVQAFNEGRLQPVGAATAPAHAGMGFGRGRGAGAGQGRGGGAGRGGRRGANL